MYGVYSIDRRFFFALHVTLVVFFPLHWARLTVLFDFLFCFYIETPNYAVKQIDFGFNSNMTPK